MTLVLIVLGLLAILELIVVTKVAQPRRRHTDVLILLHCLTTVGLLYVSASFASVLVSVLMLYRIFNLARLSHRRVIADHLQHIAVRASWSFIGLQFSALLLASISAGLAIYSQGWLLWLTAIALVGAAVFAHTIDRQGRVTLPPKAVNGPRGEELPSLTVAIPARNETADLEACLRTLVHNTYLKLEILVLDDCSQNPRTPELIRQFAHDGVRFIAGTPPPDSWLAKNHAYAQLAAVANGEVILFCGVDMRFEPTSLAVIVETMLAKQKTMLSVLPRNQIPGRFKIETLLVQPGRYAWELMLPRRWIDRPPVLSSCWLITAEALAAAGGFASASRTIVPERVLARYAATHHDGYSFVQSGELLGLSSAKSFDAQRATAVRTRYPSLHRRIELVALVSASELALLVMPYILLVYAAVTGQLVIGLLSAATCALLSFVYAQVTRITYQQFLLRGLWLLPFAALYDIGLLHYSMWRYELRDVIWKGRNVCIPVMQAIPYLPRIDQAPDTGSRHGRHHHGRHHRRHRNR